MSPRAPFPQSFFEMFFSFLPILLLFFVGAITAQPLNATEVAQIFIGNLNQAILNKDNNSLLELFDEKFELQYYYGAFNKDRLFELFIDVPPAKRMTWKLMTDSAEHQLEDSTEQHRIRFVSTGFLPDLNSGSEDKDDYYDFVEFFMNVTTQKVFFAETVDFEKRNSTTNDIGKSRVGKRNFQPLSNIQKPIVTEFVYTLKQAISQEHSDGKMDRVLELFHSKFVFKGCGVTQDRGQFLQLFLLRTFFDQFFEPLNFEMTAAKWVNYPDLILFTLKGWPSWEFLYIPIQGKIKALYDINCVRHPESDAIIATTPAPDWPW